MENNSEVFINDFKDEIEFHLSNMPFELTNESDFDEVDEVIYNIREELESFEEKINNKQKEV